MWVNVARKSTISQEHNADCSKPRSPRVVSTHESGSIPIPRIFFVPRESFCPTKISVPVLAFISTVWQQYPLLVKASAVSNGQMTSDDNVRCRRPLKFLCPSWHSRDGTILTRKLPDANKEELYQKYRQASHAPLTRQAVIYARVSS